MKKTFASILVLLILLIVGICTLGYYGQRSFDKAGSLPSAEDVVVKAKSLIGTPYDPINGEI